jgi:uncharacterized protein
MRERRSAGLHCNDAVAARVSPYAMNCRAQCGACCIAPSISSPIPGMPDGKPAGVRCIHLTGDMRCAIYGHPDRPRVCGSLEPSLEMCGKDAEEAFTYLERLEIATRSTM